MKTKQLFDYQQKGVEFLKTLPKLMLADEPGLGKSAQVIVAAGSSGHHLIVCPAIMRRAWLREYWTWASKFSLIPQVVEKLSDRANKHGPVICSYEYAHANSLRLAEHRWDTLILDEAHLVKSHKAQRTHALLGRQGIGRNAARIWWLTGTPMEHSPADLWLPLFFSGVTKLSRDAFLSMYCEGYRGPDGEFRVTGVNKRTLGLLAMELKASGFFLRRTKKEVGIQLPALTISELATDNQTPPSEFPDLDLTKMERERELLAHVIGDVSKFNEAMLAELQADAESVSTLLRYLGLCKVRATANLVLQELEAREYDAIVIGYKHKQVGDALQSHLSPRLEGGLYRIDGDTPILLRDSQINHFQASQTPRIMLLQIKAGGVGITLTAASQAIVVEAPWDPATLDQFFARLHRIGQINPVTGRIVTLNKEPLDRAILNVVARKANDIGGFLDAVNDA